VNLQRSFAKISAFSTLLGLAVSSCSGGGSTLPSGASSPAQAFPRSDARPSAANALYVSDWYGKSVFRFVRNAAGTLQTLAGSSLVLSYNPGPIAIDSNGELLVTDDDSESLFMYAKGASGYGQPQRELGLPFVPSCVAVDPLGDEFVGGFSNGYVAVYAPGAKGNAKTLQRIALPDGHPDVNGVAVDASGDMFVSDSNEVSEFTTPVTNPTLARAIVGTGQQKTARALRIVRSYPAVPRSLRQSA
jgi:hypothetical protein